MPQRGCKSWLLPTLSLYDLNWEKSIQIRLTAVCMRKIKAGGDAGTAIIFRAPFALTGTMANPA
jgi:hypothetical protein